MPAFIAAILKIMTQTKSAMLAFSATYCQESDSTWLIDFCHTLLFNSLRPSDAYMRR